jgi:hypothetical protein
MITWLQTFFLKHNKWLFGSLLIVIIVTFVLTIGPQSFFDGSSPQRRESIKFYGYDLSSEADQRAMVFNAEISAILQPELQVRRDQLMDYAYLRIAALGIARQLGVPEPDREALTTYIESLGLFADPRTGEFSAESYNDMMDALQSSGRYSREFIARVLREDYQIAQVRKALGGPAYSLPFEVERDFLEGQTSHTVMLAHYAYDRFDPEIAPDVEELRQYFRENPGRYEIPETLSTTALHFTAAAWLDTIADPAESELEARFNANRDQYAPEPAQSPEDGEPAEVTLADVRDAVAADWKRQQAARIAARKSEQFSLRLWQESVPLDSEAFQQLLEEFRVQMRELPPYAREQAPRIEGVPDSLLNSMWIYSSNPNRYFSDIAQVDDGAVILVSRGLTEARMPDFEEVARQVEQDYVRAEKRRLFAEKGKELRDEITARLKDEDFSGIAAALELEVEQLDPFTGATVPFQLQRSAIWDQSRFLDAGEVSSMILEEDRGTFLFMAEKSVPDIDPDSEEYAAYLARRDRAINEAMGWARLREITDKGLNALLGTSMLQ